MLNGLLKGFSTLSDSGEDWRCRSAAYGNEIAIACLMTGSNTGQTLIDDHVSAQLLPTSSKPDHPGGYPARSFISSRFLSQLNRVLCGQRA